MGRKITIPGVVFTNNALLKIPQYDVLESPGSLFLFEPGHSLSGIAAGVVPVGGASISNIVWPLAAARLGSGTAATLAGAVVARSNDSSIWKVERTGKGGLHGLITQAGAQVSELAWLARVPTAVKDYIRANLPGRQFYFSSWRKITRPGIENPAPQSHFHSASNTSNYLFHSERGGAITSGQVVSIIPSTTDITSAVGTNRFVAGQLTAVTGTLDISTSIDFGLGTHGAWGDFNFNKAVSAVLYRVYIEDLTASGRSFATVSALDKAAFDAAFGVGGRYENDTHTNPSTLP